MLEIMGRGRPPTSHILDLPLRLTVTVLQVLGGAGF